MSSHTLLKLTRHESRASLELRVDEASDELSVLLFTRVVVAGAEDANLVELEVEQLEGVNFTDVSEVDVDTLRWLQQTAGPTLLAVAAAHKTRTVAA